MRRFQAFVAFALCFTLIASAQIAWSAPPEGKMRIYAMARKAGLSTLADAVEIAELQRTLQVEGPWTVFAPTNEAFAALGEETLEAVLSDRDLLTDILLYHVAPGSLRAADVLGLDAITMANGQDVMIDASAVQVNDANIVATDLIARNGVVHVIDAVLLPPSMSARVEMAKQTFAGAPAADSSAEGRSWSSVKGQYQR